MTLRIETSYQIDETTVVGKTLPSVYFDKITIQRMSDTFFLSSQNNIEDNKKSSNNDFLKIDLNVVLKDIYNGKNSGWFKNPFDKKLKNKIKVMVAQTTNEEATQLWGTLTDLSQIKELENAQSNNFTAGLLNGTNIQVFTLDELVGPGDENSITQRFSEPFSISKGTLYSFNKFLSFPAKQNTPGNKAAILIPDNQTHLCYTAFTYYEDSIVKTGPLSKITQEQVIKDGNVVKETSVFIRKDDGKIWTGPIHYHNGDVQVDGQPYVGFMGGGKHDASQEQPTLDRNVVRNSTIHDIRSLSVLEDNIIFEQPIEENQQKQESVTKNSIFSDFFMSKEPDGSVDFSFAINMNSLVKSKFLNGLNLNESALNKLMNYINIRSVKVYRVLVNRQKPLEVQSSTVQTEKPFSPTLMPSRIQSSKINKQRNTGTKTNQVGIGYKKISERKSIVDNDRELIIEADNSSGILNTSLVSGDGESSIEIRSSVYTDSEYDNIVYMTGTDATVRSSNKQYYQYELEIVLEDNRGDYLQELKLDIDEQVEKLVKISQISSFSKSLKNKTVSYDSREIANEETSQLFNVSINKFTNSFIRDISFSNKLVNISGDFWDQIPTAYLKAFEVVSYNKIPSSILENAAMTIRNMLNPMSGDPNGYERIIKMLRAMSDALSRNVLLSRKNYGSKNQKNPVSKSKASKNNNNPLFNQITINHVFRDSTLSTNFPKFFGNMFFKMNEQQLPNTTSGLRTITYEEFIGYKNSEMEKIYSSPNADISISSLPDAQINLDVTSYGYFTPSMVYNQKENPEPIETITSFGENYIDVVVNSLTVDDNVNLKSDLGNVGKTTTEKTTNELNGKLANLFAQKYNVSIATEERQYNVFNPKTSKKNLKSPTLNDVGGKLKTNPTIKKISSKQTANSMQALRSLLNTKLVTSEQRPIANKFNPNILSVENDEPSRIVSTLPNQLKSLVIAQDGNKNISFSPSPGIKSDIVSLIRNNPFSNPSTSYVAKNLFENIVMVQYLSGYGRNLNNSISVKDEEWKLLTKDVFENARSSGRRLFCRLMPYSNTKFNVNYDMKLPIIDSYFYIGDTEENATVEVRSEPVIQTNPLSMTFDNPQYQFTYFSPPQTNSAQAINNSRPVQYQVDTVTVSTPSVGGGGGSSY